MVRDIVFPDGNESEFLKMAELLGYDELVMIYPTEKLPKKQFGSKVKVSFGVLVDGKRVGQDRKGVDWVFVKSSKSDRDVIERNKGVVLFGLELKGKKDFIHQRNSGLNHVLCKLANQNKNKIGFGFSYILSNKIIGRAKQNIKLCKKYGVGMVFGSFAKEAFEMRAYHDLNAFFDVI